jgi:hypothetical protein
MDIKLQMTPMYVTDLSQRFPTDRGSTPTASKCTCRDNAISHPVGVRDNTAYTYRAILLLLGGRRSSSLTH